MQKHKINLTKNFRQLLDFLYKAMGCQDVREEFLPKLGIHFSKDVKRIAFPLQTPEDWDQIKLEWNNEVLRPKKKDILLAELRVNEMVCFIYSTSIIVVYSSIIY